VILNLGCAHAVAQPAQQIQKSGILFPYTLLGKLLGSYTAHMHRVGVVSLMCRYEIKNLSITSGEGVMKIQTTKNYLLNGMLERTQHVPEVCFFHADRNAIIITRKAIIT
jgi:hypothetical protein